MATGGYQFEQPAMNWNAKDMYEEFKRFKEHVDFVFSGPLCKAEKNEKTGWLGMWVGLEGREAYKTFTWEEGEKDYPDEVLHNYEQYVKSPEEQASSTLPLLSAETERKREVRQLSQGSQTPFNGL